MVFWLRQEKKVMRKEQNMNQSLGFSIYFFFSCLLKTLLTLE